MLDFPAVLAISGGLVVCAAVGIYTLLEMSWRVITNKCLVYRILSLYAGIGLLLGYAMKLALPAISWLGVFYYALIWPAFVSAGTFHTPAPPIPDWVFHFSQ